MEVRFYSLAEKKDLRFVVIGATAQGKSVWCRHRERTTWEMPGGHIEPGENPLAAAARELREETGALEFDLEPVCIYAVVKDGTESCGMLLRAEIHSFGPLEHEIEELSITGSLPDHWTYPGIQPYLLKKLSE